jgi:hypothetical protein
MKTRPVPTKRTTPVDGRLKRRAFLRGMAGACVALPFLESLPERSAWASDEKPVFSLFICAACGVVPARFFPDQPGPLTSSALSASDKATRHLGGHAEHLLFLSGIDWNGQTTGEPHAIGLCHALTARAPLTTDQRALAAGPSADVVIASHVHPEKQPLALFAGAKEGYIDDRLSFAAAGELRLAEQNPYKLYLELMGLATPGGGMTPESEAAARLLARSRNSIHDLVRDDLTELMGNSRLSAADRQRLQQHFDAIRDTEITMGDLGCTLQGLDTAKLANYETYSYDARATTEETLRLHMSLVALAFACNYRRTATIQWGNGTDHTIYDVPSNPGAFRFNWICHRVQSDGSTGDVIPNAEAAHAEIDAVRMQSLAAGLDHFKARGLQNECFVMWTNQFRDGPAHSFRSVPHIVWGNARGYLRQGESMNLGSVTNNRLHNALISAAIQDTGATVENFGEGPITGQLEAILA